MTSSMPKATSSSRKPSEGATKSDKQPLPVPVPKDPQQPTSEPVDPEERDIQQRGFDEGGQRGNEDVERS